MATWCCTTDHPLHHFVHQQLLFGSGQQEKVTRLLNNQRPQSVHHIAGKLLDGAHPTKGHTRKTTEREPFYL